MVHSASSGTTRRAASGFPVLARLVGPDTESFATSVWGRQAILTCATPAGTVADSAARGFADLLGQAGVDELVSTRGLRTPFLRVSKNGDVLNERLFTAGGGVGAGVADQLSDDKLHRLFADGATLVLQGLHRVWPPIITFAQALSAELGHPVQVNAYITPPQSQGFAAHFDVHDVFVLQLFGSKRWQIREPVHPWPLRDQPWTDFRAAIDAAGGTDPVIDTELNPGDCLYLPRGYLHSATALGEVSGHLTVGVHVWTEHTVAEELLRLALQPARTEPQARASLPLGVDVGCPASFADTVAQVRSRLHAALEAVDDATLGQALDGRARNSQRAAPLFPLAQAQAARQVHRGSTVVLREHLQLRTRPTPSGGVLLISRAGAKPVQVPAEEASVLAVLLEGRAVTPADLDLPEEHALALVTRLLRAGVLVPVTAGTSA